MPSVSRPRTVMGFDFGRVRIGVAIGQELTATASPLTTLQACRQQPDWERITQLIEQWRPALLVVGVPRHADGSPNAVTAAALRFSRQLHGRYRLTVATIDERLSSRAAAALLSASGAARRQRPNRAAVDATAAMLIVESWFNQCNRSPGLDH
jgi:putative Holliday junction resolvase